MQIISAPKIVHQGIDTLVFGINCTDEAVFLTKFKRFVSIVKTAKEAAQAEKPCLPIRIVLLEPAAVRAGFNAADPCGVFDVPRDRLF